MLFFFGILASQFVYIERTLRMKHVKTKISFSVCSFCSVSFCASHLKCRFPRACGLWPVWVRRLCDLPQAKYWGLAEVSYDDFMYSYTERKPMSSTASTRPRTVLSSHGICVAHSAE